MRFVWDPIKAKQNEKKHKISFQEAVSVFLDPNALRIFDQEHSLNEDRWVLLGLSKSFRILVIVHIVIEDEENIRIISARKALRSETKDYEENLR
jgi:uncharacterized DUF497 family protein